MEDMASILQDSLRRMENMFASVIYQNAHGGAPAACAPPQQYATPPQQYAAPPCQYATPPPQQYSAPPPQSYTASAVPTSAGPCPEQKCHFDGCSRMIRDCPGAMDYINRASANGIQLTIGLSSPTTAGFRAGQRVIILKSG
jgi:hypothetical protein